MKLETTAGALKGALSLMSRVVPRRATAPLLETVQFDGATLSGTNLGEYLTVQLACTRAKGRAAILLRPLAALVRNVGRDANISIEAGEQGATLTFPGGRYDLPTVEWEALDLSGEFATEIAVDSEAFRDGLRFCKAFVSFEETRYYLNGVCLDEGHMVATDGHRMGVFPVALSAAEMGRPIITTNTVALLAALAPAKAVRLDTGRQAMRFTLPGMTLTAKLIDGNYPDWRRVVPDTASAIEIRADRRALAGAVNRMHDVLACAGIRGHGVGLAYDADGLVVCGRTTIDLPVLAREYLTEAATIGVKDPGSIEFNARYLGAALAQFDHDNVVRLMVSSPGSAALLRGAGAPYAVMMPMRGGASSDLALSTLKDWAHAQVAAA